MKKAITRIAVLLLFTFHSSLFTAFAQAPQAFNYQAVARDAGGNLIINHAVGINIILHQTTAGGTIVYSETFTKTTNQFGLFTLPIGQGLVTSGNFNSIVWGSYNYWLQVQIDPTGGTMYTDMGTTQLLSVPYAMCAANGGTKVSSFQPAGCQSLASVNNTFQKIADMGTFNKTSASTFIELNLQTSFYVSAFAGSCYGVVFELRVDGVATTIGNATLIYQTAGTIFPGNITGIYSNLSTGTHTVSLWVKTAYDTATNATYDFNCWNTIGTNNVLVKEYY